MCERILHVCWILWVAISLKKLEVNRGFWKLERHCIWGDSPPPLVLSPWVSLKKLECQLEAEGTGNSRHGEGYGRYTGRCFWAKGCPFLNYKKVSYPLGWHSPGPESREGCIPAWQTCLAKRFHASHKLYDPSWEPDYLSLQNHVVL